MNKAWHDPEDTPLAATIYVNDGWLFINGGTFEAVQEGQAIKLVRDIDLGDSTFETNKSYTLELNRHTLKSSAEQTVLSTGGSLTIQGDYFWHEGWLKNTHSSGSAVRATGGDLTINFGEYSGAYGVTAAGETTTVDINSWYSKTFIKGSAASVAVEGGATFNINDGYYSHNA